MALTPVRKAKVLLLSVSHRLETYLQSVVTVPVIGSKYLVKLQ